MHRNWDGLSSSAPWAMIGEARPRERVFAMTTAILDAKTHEFDVEDVEYLRHGDKPLLARVFKPRGDEPFPALVECHGGAWCLSDRTTERLRHEAMAAHGIVSIALDFRSGNEAPYPASVQDINYAVRWAKLNARALKTRPELVGLSGQSSGGHLAMLVAMRPHDPRYAAISLPPGSPAHDATVRCLVMSWPVINPLSRYRLAKRALAGANPPEWPKTIIPRQDAYCEASRKYLNVSIFDETIEAQLIEKRSDGWPVPGTRNEKTNAIGAARLLRPRPERPRNRRAAQESDELAAFHVRPSPPSSSATARGASLPHVQ